MKKRLISIVVVMALLIAIVPVSTSAESISQQKETAHFVFYCASSDTAMLNDLDALADGLEEYYSQATRALGFAPTTKTPIHIYPTYSDFQDINYQLWTWRPQEEQSQGCEKNGVVYLAPRSVFTRTAGIEHMLSVASHEFTHRLIALFGRTQPSYLNEGTASFLANKYCDFKVSSLWRMPQAIEENSLPRIEQLSSYSSGMGNDDTVYLYGEAFIDFIDKTFGFDAVVGLLKGDSRYQITHLNDSELNDLWIDFLRVTYGPGKLIKETDEFSFYTKNDDFSIESIESVLHDCRQRIQKDLKRSVDEPTRVIIYPDKESFLSAIRQDDAWTDVACAGANNTLHLIAPSKCGKSYEQALAEVKFHYAYIAANLSSAPMYLSFGIRYHESDFPRDMTSIVSRDEPANMLPTISAIEASTQGESILYNYTGAYITFLADTFGYDKIRALLDGNSRYETISLNETELNSQWHGWLRDKYLSKETTAPDISPLNPEETDYGLITRIDMRTNVSELLETISIPEGCRAYVTDLHGSECSRESSLTTGQVLHVIDSVDHEQTVHIVVRGDALGTGRMDIAQLVRIAKGTNNSQPLSGLNLLAADMNSDGKVNIVDLTAAGRLMQSIAA